MTRQRPLGCFVLVLLSTACLNQSPEYRHAQCVPGDAAKQCSGNLLCLDDNQCHEVCATHDNCSDPLQQCISNICHGGETPSAEATPPSGAAISGNTPIVLTFSQGMDETSVRISGVLAPESDGGAWTARTRGYDRLVIAPTGAWIEGHERALVIDANSIDHRAATTLRLSYTVDSTPPVTLASTPAGSYDSALEITLLCDDGDGAGCGETRYSVDGSEPDESSRLYEGPLAVTRDTILQYFSVDGAGNREPIQVQDYIVDTIPPRVVAYYPYANADRVPAGEPVRVTFSEDIDLSSVLSDGIALGDVTGEVSYDDATFTLVFTPTSHVASNVRLQATVRGRIADHAGNVLGSDLAWSFSTAAFPRATTVPMLTTGAIHDGVTTATNAAGDVLAVWTADTGTRQELLGAIFDAASASWLPEMTIAAPVRDPTLYANSYSGSPKSHVVAAAGETFAVTWAQKLDGTTNVYAAIVTAGNIARSTLATNADSPAVASNGTGFCAAWRYTAGTYSDVVASVYSAGVWGTKATLDSAALNEHASSPAVASNGSGYAVVWKQGTKPYGAVRATSTWAAATALLDASVTRYAIGPLGIISNGSGYLATWTQADTSSASSPYRVYAATHASASWTAATVALSTTAVTWSETPQVDSDGVGYAVVWVSGADIYAATYISTWSGGSVAIDPVLLVGAATTPRVASDGSDYTLVWRQTNGSTSSVHASTYSGGIWSDGATPLNATGLGGAAGSPSIAANADGYAIAWPDQDGDVTRVYGTTGSGGSWSGVASVVAGSHDVAGTPHVLPGGAGYVAMWAQSGVHGEYQSLWGSTHAVEWLQATDLISGVHSQSVRAARVAGDAVGNVFVSAEESYVWYTLAAAYATGRWSQAPSKEVFNVHSYVSWPKGFAFAGFRYLDTGTRAVTITSFANQTWTDTNVGSASDILVGAAPELAAMQDALAVTWVRSDPDLVDLDVATATYENGSWRTDGMALDAELGQATVRYPHITSNGLGYAVAWTSWSGGAWSVYASVYDDGAWTTFPAALNAVNVVPGVDTSWELPRIVSNGDGYAVAWSQYDGTWYSVYVATYTNGAWQIATQPLDSPALAGSAWPVQLTSNGGGYAAAWLQTVGVRTDAYAATWSDGVWSPAVQLSSANVAGSVQCGDPGCSTLASVGAGGGYALVWTQSDGLTTNTYASVFEDGVWSSADVPLAPSLGGDAYGPVQLASNDEGYAAVWQQDQNSSSNIYASIYSAGAWTPGFVLNDSPSNEPATSPSVTAIGSQYAAVWLQHDPATDAAVQRVWAVMGF